MTLEELRTLPDGAIVKAGLYVYQKHDDRFKSWFCVEGHTAERMLDPDVVRQPVEVIAAIERNRIEATGSANTTMKRLVQSSPCSVEVRSDPEM